MVAISDLRAATRAFAHPRRMYECPLSAIGRGLSASAGRLAALAGRHNVRSLSVAFHLRYAQSWGPGHPRPSVASPIGNQFAREAHPLQCRAHSKRLRAASLRGSFPLFCPAAASTRHDNNYPNGDLNRFVSSYPPARSLRRTQAAQARQIPALRYLLHVPILRPRRLHEGLSILPVQQHQPVPVAQQRHLPSDPRKL
jgi:hypothetical protein